MNTLIVQGNITPQYIPEQRHYERIHIPHLLAVTRWGTGQILEINHRGLSFGCLYPHNFEEQWAMDILDARGAHVKELEVMKIWETRNTEEGAFARFELVVGVAFVKPTHRQIVEINNLLETTEDDMQYADLL